MSLSFQANIWMIVIKKIVETIHGVDDVSKLALVLRFIFACIWLTFTGTTVKGLWLRIRDLSREKNRVKGQARAEARWARRVLLTELFACLAAGLTTFGFWGLMESMEIIKWIDPRCYEVMKKHFLSETASIVHRADLIVNALSVAVFSGLLFQIPPPANDIVDRQKNPANWTSLHRHQHWG